MYSKYLSHKGNRSFKETEKKYIIPHVTLENTRYKDREVYNHKE